MINQSGFILTNQDRAFWTNQTVRIWLPHLHEDRPIRNQGRDFLQYKSAPDRGNAQFPFPAAGVGAESARRAVVAQSPAGPRRVAEPGGRGAASRPLQPGLPRGAGRALRRCSGAALLALDSFLRRCPSRWGSCSCGAGPSWRPWTPCLSLPSRSPSFLWHVGGFYVKHFQTHRIKKSSVK